jgi:hypothetical protein
VRDTYNQDLFVKRNNRDTTNVSNFIFDSKAIPELLSVVPNEYHDKEFDMKKFYLEIVTLKNGGANQSTSLKFNMEETISTQACPNQSILKKKESRRPTRELNLPFPTERKSKQVHFTKLDSQDSVSTLSFSIQNSLKKASPYEYENQDSVSTAAFSVQNSLFQIPSIISQPQEMLDHQITSNQEIHINEAHESAENSIEETNPIQEWISKLDPKM